jgi:hypothetical protein
MEFRYVAYVVAAALSLAGCGILGGKDSAGDTRTVQTSNDPYHTEPQDLDPKFRGKTQTENDPGAFTLMATLFASQGGQNSSPAGIGVNSFLWRASLDTVSFMPLASADPFGGVIITDWYSPPDTPDERFKVNVFILGRDLRADGVRASVFHQKKDPAGQWAEALVDANTATDIENAILTRARQIRLSAVANQQ